MIQIDEEKLVGEGGMRLVFTHPLNEKKIIKIFKPNATPELKRKYKWFKTLLPASAFDANRRDLHEHTKARKKSSEIAIFICPIYEIVETNIGPGLVCDLVIDENGQTSLPLVEHVRKFGREATRVQLDHLFDLLAQHHILFRDANANNILVQIRGGKEQLVIIEGLGESNFIPYASVSKYLNARKVMRKKARILAMLRNIVRSE